MWAVSISKYFFVQEEDGIRDSSVTGVQTCDLRISTYTAVEGHSDSRVSRGQRGSSQVSVHKAWQVAAKAADIRNGNGGILGDFALHFEIELMDRRKLGIGGKLDDVQPRGCRTGSKHVGIKR